MADFLDFLFFNFSGYLCTTSKRERGGGESEKEKERDAKVLRKI